MNITVSLTTILSCVGTFVTAVLGVIVWSLEKKFERRAAFREQMAREENEFITLVIETLDAQGAYLEVLADGSSKAFENISSANEFRYLKPFNGNLKDAKAQYKEIRSQLRHHMYSKAASRET